ncbi:MAG: YihY/virulence factor BrkB family protein [Candidatus Dormiibacterota bacterium]
MRELVDRLQQRLVGRWLITYFIESPGPHYAPAIAFTAFVASFPIVLGIESLILLTNPKTGLAGRVGHVFLEAFPVGTRTEVAGVLGTVIRHPGTVGLLSLLAMLWAGSAMFACLGAALNAMHGTHGRNLIHQRVMGIRLIFVLLVALVIVVTVENLTGGLPLAVVTGPLLAGLVLVMLLGFIYRIAPNIHRSPRDVLPGAVIAAVLIELATYSFPLYTSVTSEIDTYGKGVALALILLFWLWLCSHIILLGAHFNDTRWEMRAERAAAAEDVGGAATAGVGGAGGII